MDMDQIGNLHVPMSELQQGLGLIALLQSYLCKFL